MSDDMALDADNAIAALAEAREDREKIVARLRAHNQDTDRDSETLAQWDTLRGMLLHGNRGDMPRMIFESIIDVIADDCLKAADLIEADGKRLGLAEKALVDAAQFMDGVKPEAVAEGWWSGWDTSTRNRISVALAAIAALHTPSPKEAESSCRWPNCNCGTSPSAQAICEDNHPTPAPATGESDEPPINLLAELKKAVTPAPATGDTRPFGWACQRRTLAGPEPGPNIWTDFKEGRERPRDTRKWFPAVRVTPQMVEAGYAEYCRQTGLFRTAERDRASLAAFAGGLRAALAVSFPIQQDAGK